jgi:hypothetical protein
MPFALYLVMGRVAATERLRHLEDGVPNDSIEAPAGCVWEYRAVCELARLYRDADDQEIGYPDKLRYLLHDGKWSVQRVLRAGRFRTQADIVTDEDLVEESGGTSGASATAFRTVSSPARSGHWSRARSGIATCLFGNPPWEAVFEHVLDEVEVDFPTAEIIFAAFNPCDLIGSIVNTVTGIDSLPHLEFQVVVDNEVVRHITGTVAYRTQPNSLDAMTAFTRVYGDASGWGIARNFGATWDIDIEFCRLTGLAYVCAEFLPMQDGTWLEIQDATLLRTEMRDDSPRPLHNWLDANRDSLRLVIAEMSAHTRGIFPGLDNEVTG